MITGYHELNSSFVDELTEEPTPLEFMRYVHLNRPFVVRKGAKDWTAVQQWDVAYLKSKLDDTPVNVACTPFGNADAVVQLEDGSLVFVKPYEITQPFCQAMMEIQHQQSVDESTDAKWTCYLQTQNDNLRGEYLDIFEDVPNDVAFARIALQKPPDAINFWLGNSRSVTALHKDNYENIYVQVLGQKHFVLMPPVEAACVNEQDIPAATYRPADSKEHKLQVLLDSPGNSSGCCPTVPFATWDPDVPHVGQTFASYLAQPIHITLGPGDMLYLPAQWYHKVKQSCSPEGICVAVNYWYDMEFSGAFHSMTCFVRDVGKSAHGLPA